VVEEETRKAALIAYAGAQGISDQIILGLTDLSADQIADLLAGIISPGISQALSIVRGDFEISSPSAVWREQVGEPIAAGIAQGIIDTTPEVVAALVEMMGAMDEAAQGADEWIDTIVTAIDDMGFDAVEALGIAEDDWLAARQRFWSEALDDEEEGSQEWINMALRALEDLGPAAAAAIDVSAHAIHDAQADLFDTLAEQTRDGVADVLAAFDGLSRMQDAYDDFVAAMASGDLSEQLGAGAALIGANLDYERQLQAMVANFTTQKDFVQYARSLGVPGLGEVARQIWRQVHPMAGGGFLSTGGIAMVGEAGPELVVMDQNGATVIPLADLMGYQGGGLVPRSAPPPETIRDWDTQTGSPMPEPIIGQMAGVPDIGGGDSLGYFAGRLADLNRALLGARREEEAKPVQGPVIVNVYNAGYVATEMDLVKTVRKELLRLQGRNATTGIV